MAYDDAVADRVRALLKRRKGISERKMFGGIAFMLNGNMVCGVMKEDLVSAPWRGTDGPGVEGTAHQRNGFYRQGVKKHGVCTVRRDLSPTIN